MSPTGHPSLLSHRQSGLLLHITSLPSPHGIGDLGPSAYRFIDLLERAGQSIWQVLPLVPPGYGNSPYSSYSTFAGNPLLLSPDRLRRDGLVPSEALPSHPSFPESRVAFNDCIPHKYDILEIAFDRYERKESEIDQTEFRRFIHRTETWLDDYALFMTLKERFDARPWTEWPKRFAERTTEGLQELRNEAARTIRKHKFWQWLFDRQWSSLKTYANQRGVKIFGDLPIYVAHDSADVWANPDLFRLDDEGNPTVVAGVPPDYFSETGQRWGNPIYRWDRMKQRDYKWWTARMRTILKRVDLVRLDHFRGFEAYWEIPAEDDTAVNGQWVEGPGMHLFDALEEAVGPLPIVAENLGLITPEVDELRRNAGFPGMAVLQFGLADGPDSTHLPHHYSRDVAAYTGTHDNNTIRGWWNSVQTTNSGDENPAEFARNYLNLSEPVENLHWPAIRTIHGSVANLAVIPVQDLLGLDADSRMNVPGSEGNNWTWRATPEQLSNIPVRRLQQITRTYDRLNQEEAPTSNITSRQP